MVTITSGAPDRSDVIQHGFEAPVIHCGLFGHFAARILKDIGQMAERGFTVTVRSFCISGSKIRRLLSAFSSFGTNSDRRAAPE